MMKRPLTAALLAGLTGLTVLAAGSAAGQSASGQDNPRFRAGVDLAPIDVTVVDQQGRPVADLGAQDFKVFIDGAARRVLSAEWISLIGSQPRPEAPERQRAEGYTSNDQSTAGRLIVLAVDQANIRFGGGRALGGTIDRFLDRLSSSDRIALVGLGRGTQSIPFTADRDRIKQGVARMNGQLRPPTTTPDFGVSLSLSAAAAVTRGNTAIIQTLLENCVGLGSRNDRQACEVEIDRQATEIVHNATEPRDATMRSLADLLTSLKSIDAPKSLVLISEGFALFDDDDDARLRLSSLGALAAAARVSIYALRLDDRIFDSAGAARSISPGDTDAQIRADGLETLTSAARGTLFTVTNTGEAAFDRIESELSGYYLLGVELGPDLPRGKPFRLRVEVDRKGTAVRARTTITAPGTDQEAPDRSPLAAAATALTTPLTLSALPLRVISFSYQGPDPSRIQLLIHADVGEGYRGPQSVSVAYMITDAKGQVVASEAVTEQVAPAAAGLPSPLAFAAGTALPPGDYLLKLAAAEGNKVGSVEAPIHVSLVDAGALKLSDLTVGGPFPSGGEPTRPTVDYTVRFGQVHGFLEAYGPGSATATVRYEIARDEQSPALLTEVVPARRVNESRALFSRRISVAALPPGRYYLRASIALADAAQKTPPKTMSRVFEIVQPAALAATANTSRTDVVTDSATELFLPLESGDLSAPFQTADALRPETLEPFIARVPAAARPGFDAGVDYLRKRNYPAAETSFKRAIVPNLDFTAAVAYLAVTFAASGHHVEAASAWQTALIGGSDLPQIYWWLGHALLQTHDFARARSTLEDAARRWPAETRFARPLALLNATTGRTYEAVQQLQRYLAATHGDVDALYLGVQWIYHIHLNGGMLSDGAADLKLARTYADEYKRANGPKQLLVTQWLDYLAKSEK